MSIRRPESNPKPKRKFGWGSIERQSAGGNVSRESKIPSPVPADRPKRPKPGVAPSAVEPLAQLSAMPSEQPSLMSIDDESNSFNKNPREEEEGEEIEEEGDYGSRPQTAVSSHAGNGVPSGSSFFYHGSRPLTAVSSHAGEASGVPSGSSFFQHGARPLTGAESALPSVREVMEQQSKWARSAMGKQRLQKNAPSARQPSPSSQYKYPSRDEWPQLNDKRFEHFMAQMLTGTLPNFKTKDFTMGPAEVKNNCSTNTNQEIQLAPYQEALPRIIGPNSPLNRLLVVASTGTGKTCSIHAIAAAYLKQRKPPKIIVIVPTQLVHDEIIKQAMVCPGPIRTELVKKLKLDWSTQQQECKKRIAKFITVKTYVTATHAIAKDPSFFKNSVVFMDEIHNLVLDAKEQANGKWVPTYESYFPKTWRNDLTTLYHTLLNQKHDKYKTMFKNSVIIGFTATPIVNHPEDLFLLVNMLFGEQLVDPSEFRAKYCVRSGDGGSVDSSSSVDNESAESFPHVSLTTDPVLLDELRLKLRHTMVIYDNAHDIDRFPQFISDVPIPMIPDIYVDYGKTQRAQILQKGKVENSLATVAPRVAQTRKKEFEDDEFLEEECPKVAMLIAKVKQMFESGLQKQMIYSYFTSSGAELVKTCLLTRGFEEYTGNNQRRSRRRKRFIYIKGGEEGAAKQREQDLVAVFNSEENKDGSIIPLIILTHTGTEGLDLNGVQAVHLLEQPSSVARFNQVIGRARRLCSHKYYEYPTDWIVIIFQYIAYDDEIVELSADLHNKQIRLAELQLIQDTMKVAGSVAMDCVTNQIRTGFECRFF